MKITIGQLVRAYKQTWRMGLDVRDHVYNANPEWAKKTTGQRKRAMIWWMGTHTKSMIRYTKAMHGIGA